MSTSFRVSDPLKDPAGRGLTFCPLSSRLQDAGPARGHRGPLVPLGTGALRHCVHHVGGCCSICSSHQPLLAKMPSSGAPVLWWPGMALGTSGPRPSVPGSWPAGTLEPAGVFLCILTPDHPRPPAGGAGGTFLCERGIRREAGQGQEGMRGAREAGWGNGASSARPGPLLGRTALGCSGKWGPLAGRWGALGTGGGNVFAIPSVIQPLRAGGDPARSLSPLVTPPERVSVS